MNADCARSYARLAGLLVLVSLVAGGFGEAYAPSRLIVSADPAATLRNIADSIGLYRASFAAYLVEAVCDVTLTFIFYLLLKPVSRHLALLAAFFGLISTATFAGSELFYFAPSLLVSGSSAVSDWSIAQQEVFTQGAMLLYGLGSGIFMVFYGVATLLRGILIFRSGYLPRSLGVLLIVGGLGFVLENTVVVLLPKLDSALYALPMFVAMLALAGWLSVKGLDGAAWTIRARARE